MIRRILKIFIMGAAASKERERLALLQDEFTEEMHQDLLSISEENELKNKVYAFLGVIEDGLLSRERAIKRYGLTEDIIKKYEYDWYLLRNQSLQTV